MKSLVAFIFCPTLLEVFLPCFIPHSFVDPEWIFSDPDPTFHSASDLAWIFSDILNIYFTFVFPSCECVRLYIMTSYVKAFHGKNFFLIKRKSTDARIRKDFFRICIRIRNLLKVSDPTGSGSTTLMPRSAGLCFFYSTKSVLFCHIHSVLSSNLFWSVLACSAEPSIIVSVLS